MSEQIAPAPNAVMGPKGMLTTVSQLAGEIVRLCREQKIHGAEFSGDDFKVTVRIKKARRS